MIQVTSSFPAFTIGLDLGDRKSHYLVVDPEGREVRSGTVATTGPGLQATMSRYRGGRVVMEATTHSPWVSELLANIGLEVIVANPRELPVAGGWSRDKTDKIDAELLARLGRADPTLLRPVTHRPRALREVMVVVQSRKTLVEARTKLINSVRGQLKSLDGSRVRKCDTRQFTKAAREVVPEGITAFDGILESIDELAARIRAADGHIARLVKDLPEVQRMAQVPGVGPLTALTFMLVIHDVSRFSKSRSVGAYLGLVPRKFQSGNSDPQLSITKRGDPYARSLFVSAAHYILGPLNRGDSDLRRFGLAMIGDGGNRALKKKAVVAVARKTAVLLYALWRSGEDYDPLRNTNRRRLVTAS